MSAGGSAGLHRVSRRSQANGAGRGTLGRLDRLEVDQLQLRRELREVVEGGGGKAVLEHRREALEGRNRFPRRLAREVGEGDRPGVEAGKARLPGRPPPGERIGGARRADDSGNRPDARAVARAVEDAELVEGLAALRRLEGALDHLHGEQGRPLDLDGLLCRQSRAAP